METNTKMKPIFKLKDPKIEYLEKVKNRDITPVKILLQKVAKETFKYWHSNHFVNKNN